MRIQSSFQNWPLDEVLTNALMSLNVKSDRMLVKSPSTGYHFSLFLLRTLGSVKVVICGSATCYASTPCARWDAATGSVLSHWAFQPFRWPPMTQGSPTWADTVSWEVGGRLYACSEGGMVVALVHSYQFARRLRSRC